MTSPGGPQAGFSAGSVDLYGHLATPTGPSERCLHCNGVAGVRHDPELGTVCNLCGAPRIVLPRGVTPSGELVNAMKRAEGARRSRALWRGTSIVGGLGLAGTLLLAMIVGLVAGAGWALAIGAILGVPAALALSAGLAAGGGKTKEIARQLEGAWLAAATDVARAGQAESPADLSAALGVDAARGEELHAMLAVEAIAGSGSPAKGAQVRIVTHPDARPGGETTLPPDPRFEALEAKAEAEAAAELEARAPAATARGEKA